MSDPFFSNVKLLLHCNGTNGSTTFTDDSGTPLTMTATGDAALDTSNKKYGSAAMLNSTGRVFCSGSTFTYGTSDFTIEGWAYASDFSNDMFLFEGDTSSNLRGIYIKNNGGNVFGAGAITSGGSVFLTLADGGATPLPTNTWFHWAMCRSGNDWYLWLNGSLIESLTSVTGTPATPTSISIGGALGNAAPWVGSIDDVRVTLGTARYTTGFTPSTIEFEGGGPSGVTGTAAPTQNANTTAGAGTVSGPTGTAAVTQAKNMTAAAGTVAISGTAVSAQGLNFTTATGFLGSFSTGSAAITQNLNTVAITASNNISSSAAIAQKVSTSAAAGTVAISGTAAITQQKNIAAGFFFAPLTGTAAITQAPAVAYGYDTTLHAAAAQTMDEIAPYAHMNGGGTEPTDTLFGLVTLLLHFDWTEAAVVIPDASKTHKSVRAFGNAKINTFGTAMVGTGRLDAAAPGLRDGGVRVDDPVDFDFSSGDFTIEGIARTATPSVTMALCAGLTDGAGTTGAGPYLSIQGSALRVFFYDSVGSAYGLISGGTIPTNTSFHWACTRSGTSYKLFLNGTQVGSTVTSSTTMSAAKAIIIGNGAMFGTVGAAFAGAIDEVRITKGAARYTANFTSSTTTAFPDSGALTSLSAVAAQTIPAFTQAASVFGAGFRSAAAAQTMAAYPQVYFVSAPSRVVQGATTFVFAQTATVITTADRNLITPGDAYYASVAYLLHGDASTSSGGAHFYTDNSKNNWNVQGSLSSTITTDVLAYGGKAIAFTPTSGSSIFNFSFDSTTFDFTKSTTEMRVRFDTLNGVLPGTPDPSNPGQYTFDATQQQTGWFFSSGNGGGSVKLGLAGHNGAYEADWSSITLFGSSIDFSPYVLQIKGFVFLPSTGGFASINVFGVLPVTTGWHNVTAERNGSVVSVYLDGVFDFNFSLGAVDAGFFDGTFIAGGDISQGFAFHAEHTNLSAIEEMRHTWGVNRYGGNFTPTTGAFPNNLIGLVPPITQVATATTGAIVRVVTGAQTVFQFIQAASVFGQGPRSAAAAQTIPAFTQAASCYGQGQRTGSATQFLPPFIQVATVAPPRYVEAFAQYMLPIPQVGTITTGRTVSATQALTIRQAATVIHSVDHVTIASTFVFGQVATASAILKLTAGQIFPNFGQVAAVTSTHRLVANQLVAPFIPSTLVQSSFVGSSERTYAVRGESRVCTPLYTVP